MKRTLSSQLSQHIGKTVRLQGWLHKKRVMGGLVFVVLRDRGGLVQIVVTDEKEQAKLQGLLNGTILDVSGTVKAEPRAAGGAEIHDPKISVEVPISEAPPIEIDKPIDHNSENFDTLFDNRMLGLRNPTEQGIFRVQAAVAESLRESLSEQDFVEIHTPKLLADATEGGAEVFKLDHFGQTATLAQSPQFYKQMMVGVFERVYEIAPVYRAEPSMTTRHMSEYISVDAEMGFITGFSDVTDLLSALLNGVADSLWKNLEPELKALKATKPKLTAKIPEISMAEVHQRYSEATKKNTIGEKDLFPAEERWICEYSAEHLGSDAVFVTDWPASEMKFYHYKNPKDPTLAVRADLLFRGVEIVTASQREHRYDVLIQQLKAIGGDPDSPGFHAFLKAFKYGMPPHGGFGLGLERLSQKMIGLSSVKEASLFPRDTQRLAP